MDYVTTVTDQQSTINMALWTIASRGSSGITIYELAEKLNVSPSQVSRLIRKLHKLTVEGEPGLEMVDITFDPTQPRYKIITINAKGVAMLTEQYKLMSGITLRNDL